MRNSDIENCEETSAFPDFGENAVQVMCLGYGEGL